MIQDGIKLVAFDLDDTLAPSKSPLPGEVARALRTLLDSVEVCVISGGPWAQFELQLLSNLDASPDQLARLHLMPTCGTRYLRYDGGAWVSLYEYELPAAVRARVIDVLESEARRLGLWETETWGPAIEDRGTQVTYSALGQLAPVEAKHRWDPCRTKRNELAAALSARLPDLEVRSGGSTSVDITAKGIDKAYGIERLSHSTNLAFTEMVFIGDRLDEDGNDYPVKALGVPSLATEGPGQTASLIHGLLPLLARVEEREPTLERM